MSNAPAILASGLAKRYGRTVALDGIDLEVAAGTVLALLGPNGAGKTTAVRILATLLRPDGGRATVCGFDVAREPERVREVIALTGQYAAVDDDLTGWDNLGLIARLLGAAEPRRRAAALLERFDLTAAADRPVRTYSGGMRRRLDLALSLMGMPRVLFLDEPTTGLDPRSRAGLWDLLRALVAGGTTVLLTTQDLDEADHLAGEVAVIDRGRVIERGTPAALRARVGGQTLDVRPAERARLDDAAAAVVRAAGTVPSIDADRGLVSLRLSGRVAGTAVLAAAARELEAAAIPVQELGIRLSSLDEVFLLLTGAPAAGTGPEGRRQP